MGSLWWTAGATSGPHPGHNRPDRSGQPRSPAARLLSSSSATVPHPPQLDAAIPESLTRKRSTSCAWSSLPRRPTRRAKASCASLGGARSALGPCHKGRQRPSAVTIGCRRFIATAGHRPSRSSSCDAGGRFGLWSRRSEVGCERTEIARAESANGRLIAVRATSRRGGPYSPYHRASGNAGRAGYPARPFLVRASS
jgi:hypothetical protein